jgi:hypothetical protein
VLNTSVAEAAASFVAEFIQRVSLSLSSLLQCVRRRSRPVVRPRKIE